MSFFNTARQRLSPAVLCAAALALAGPAAAQGIGDTLSNLFKFGGTTVPKEAPRQTGDAYCPSVGLIEGSAAIRAYNNNRVGDPSALRHQISLNQFARECDEQPDGSILVKVGVEGRVLLGPAGAAGRFDAPVTFVIKRGDSILATRTQRVSIAVPAGDTQASFVTVQDGLVVPAKAGEYEIDVGLVAGAGGAKPERAAKRKRG
ncbi:MAG: hypothetical protein ACJ8DS_04640 [Microvirga sp.]